MRPAPDGLADDVAVARVRGGDIEAFGVLVRRHEAALRRYLLRLCRDASTADDIAQDAFLRAFEKIASYRGDRPFAAWLFRIAHNRWIDTLRARRNDADALKPLSETHAPPPDAARVDIDRALAVLSDDERAVVVLSCGYGMSHSEIAYVTRLPLGTVKSHALRGKKKAVDTLTPAPENRGSDDA